MKIEALIEKLQAFAAEHPGVDVVVGLDYREPCENEIEDASFVDADDDYEERIVILAPS